MVYVEKELYRKFALHYSLHCVYLKFIAENKNPLKELTKTRLENKPMLLRFVN